jgi:hypothetical protein
VPVEEDPPFTLLGLTVTEESVDEPGGLAYPPPQEYAKSETAMTLAAAARPGRCREARLKLQSINRAANQAKHATNISSGCIRGANRGPNKGGVIARGIVVSVTVAVAPVDPSSMTGEGETVHMAAVGAPVQLQVTIWLNPCAGVAETV